MIANFHDRYVWVVWDAAMELRVLTSILSGNPNAARTLDATKTMLIYRIIV